jgi:anti-anti-sigma factor
VLDCEGLVFLGSEGIRILIEVARSLEGRGDLVIRNASGICRRVIELAGLDRLPNLRLESR